MFFFLLQSMSRQLRRDAARVENSLPAVPRSLSSEFFNGELGAGVEEAAEADGEEDAAVDGVFEADGEEGPGAAVRHGEFPAADEGEGHGNPVVEDPVVQAKDGRAGEGGEHAGGR